MEQLSDAILHRDFRVVKRGYEPDAVDAFLGDFAEKIRRLETEIATAHGKLSAFERSADADKDAGLVVQDAFRVATARRDEIVAEAEAKAAAIIADAEGRVKRQPAVDPRVAEMESEVILSSAREEAAAMVSAAERRAREILRVAKVGAATEADQALAEAKQRAVTARGDHESITRQLQDLKAAVNRMLQDGAAGSEEIRLVFSGES